MITDIQAIKYVGFGGLAIFVIRELFKLIYYMMQQRRTAGEIELKNTSREKINTTNNNVAQLQNLSTEIKPHFFKMKEDLDEVHDVITEKEKGVPLVYNKGLEIAVERLNGNMLTQTTALRDLTGAIKEMKT